MPATESRRLAVLKAFQARFQAIAGPEFHYPVADASQVTLDPTTNLLTVNGADLPLYVIEASSDGSKTYYPGEHLVEIFRFNVHVRQDADNANPLARQTVLENIAADIEKAVTQDVTFGGLVYDTRLDEPQPFVGLGTPIVVLVQPVEVRIHRAYGQP